MGKVFSIHDFKEGLDVRKSPLTAPGGSLRILDNAWLTPGGEIEKRLAFVPVATLPPNTGRIFGQGGQLHVFGVDLGAINPGSAPHAIIAHELAVPPAGAPVVVRDVEAFDNGFYVLGYSPPTFQQTVWWNGAVLYDPAAVRPGALTRAPTRPRCIGITFSISAFRASTILP